MRYRVQCVTCIKKTGGGRLECMYVYVCSKNTPFRNRNPEARTVSYVAIPQLLSFLAAAPRSHLQSDSIGPELASADDVKLRKQSINVVAALRSFLSSCEEQAFGS